MKRNKLLENLSKEIGDQIPLRRYSLADMISESYKTIYQCKDNSNLKKLAESHLTDVKENPRDIEGLSRQLGLIKELIKLEESGQIKDEDLVEKESHQKKSIESLKESNEPDLTDEELDELAKHLEELRKSKKGVDECDTPKGEMNESEDEELKESGVPSGYRVVQLSIDCLIPEDLDTEELVYGFEESFPEGGGEIAVVGCQFAADMTEEYNKNGYQFRESKEGPKEEMKESVENTVEDEGDLVDEANHDTVEGKEERVIVTNEYCNESLKDFSKKSEGKAFMKTFKKLDSKLKEGTALTRQESISLYKAANSAMTQLSIELEHNPEFLSTFKESVSILSKDVNSLLESLSNGKAPSKKTMKSLAKFSEALLTESAGTYDYTDEDILICNDSKCDHDSVVKVAKNDKDAVEYLKSREIEGLYVSLPNGGDIMNASDYLQDTKINESEEEDIEDEIPAEENPEDFVGADEGDIEDEKSPEEEEFDQEYADAREEIHDELADKHEDTEDPAVQEKLAQDAEEVAILKGEDPEEEELEGGEEESVEEPEVGDESEITDDELEELKRHLKEMRETKKSIKEARRGIPCKLKK